MDKICGICRQDCSTRPRIRDAKGRYFCKECADAKITKSGRRQAPAALSPAVDAADPYNLEAEASPFPIDLARQVEAITPCPMCGRSIAQGSKICVSCGYDVDKGVQTSTKFEKSAKKGKRGHFCRECGYDVTGVRDPVCPECGTTIRVNKREAWDRETESEVIRTEWTKPAVTLGIGLVAVVGVFGGLDRLDLLPGYAMFLGVEVVVGYVILWFSFMFLGDLGTPLLNLLRLAALYVIVDSLWMLLSLVPSFWLRNAVTSLAFVGLFTNFFDVHWEDAWIVLIINWIVKMAILVFALLYMSGNL